MRILYISPYSGTTRLRFHALQRLGHDVTLFDPTRALPPSRISSPWLWHAGGPGFDFLVAQYMATQTRGQTWDIAWVDLGDLIGRESMKRLKKVVNRIVLYNVENPFVPRDRRRWDILKTVLGEYDLYCTCRNSTVDLATKHGSRRTIRLFQACDPLTARPQVLSEADKARFSSDVAFIGTWMPGRDVFAAKLLAAGVPLKIFGPNWNKSPIFHQLKEVISNDELGSEDYAKAVQGAKICLGLLSHGNKDLHTTRSIEVPSIGSVLCAERTEDHLELYREDEEALFWETEDECAEKCLNLLRNPDRLRAVAEAGHRRALANNNFYGPMLTRVLESLDVV